MMALKAESWRTPIKFIIFVRHGHTPACLRLIPPIDPCMHRFIFCCRCVVELGADPDTQPNSEIEIGGVLWIIRHKTPPISISQTSTGLWQIPNLLFQGMQKIVEETALNSASEIDTHAFLWRFDSLDEDNGFFSCWPGFAAGKLSRTLRLRTTGEVFRHIDRDFQTALSHPVLHDRVVLVLASPASTPDVPSPSEHVPVHISENGMDTSLIWLF